MHSRFGSSWDWPDNEENLDEDLSVARSKRRMRLLFIGCVLSLLLIFPLGYIPYLDWRDWPMVEPERVRVLCQTISITGKQEFLPGGRISYRYAEIPIRVWVSTVNRTLECREMAHPENVHHFDYLTHFLNLTESNLTDVVSQELLIYPLYNESLFYYYGCCEWKLDSGQGNRGHHTYFHNDRYSLVNEPYETCEGKGCFFLYYLPILLLRLAITSTVTGFLLSLYMVMTTPFN